MWSTILDKVVFEMVTSVLWKRIIKLVIFLTLIWKIIKIILPPSIQILRILVLIWQAIIILQEYLKPNLKFLEKIQF